MNIFIPSLHCASVEHKMKKFSFIITGAGLPI